MNIVDTFLFIYVCSNIIPTSLLFDDHPPAFKLGKVQGSCVEKSDFNLLVLKILKTTRPSFFLFKLSS